MVSKISAVGNVRSQVIKIIYSGNIKHLIHERFMLSLDMKTKLEINTELNKLLKIVDEATGIYRADCPELETKISALQWVLNLKNEAGKLIKLEVMLLE